MKKYLNIAFLLIVLAGSFATASCSSDNDDESSSFSPYSSGTIEGHDYVDLGLSVNWATCNIGANSPEKSGDYYPPYYWKTSARNMPHEFSGTIWDRATVMWGKKWKTPTKEEIEELMTCEWKLATLNGYNGVKVTGPNGNSIFIPMAGHSLWDYAKDNAWENYDGPFVDDEIYQFNEALTIRSGSEVPIDDNGHYRFVSLRYAQTYTTGEGEKIVPNGIYELGLDYHNEVDFVYPIRPVTNTKNSSSGNTDSDDSNVSYEKPDIGFYDFTATKTSLKIQYKIYNKDEAKVSSAKIYYGTSSASTAKTATVSGVMITANISGLKAGTTYYVKCVATGKGGTTTTETTKVMTNY